jgi:hypothetical protein
MAMIFVMPCCKAGEEIDRLKEAYERKFSKPITQQLEELDGLAQEAIAAGRPLVIAFGTSRMEKDNLILTKYKNPFIVWILNSMMYMPENKKQFSNRVECQVHRLQQTYEKDMANNQSGATEKRYDDLSDDEKIDFCISIISDPCLIAADITKPELYEGLSLRYPGCFDLITTDIGVTDKFGFSYDALKHYVRLLSDTGIMAFNPHGHGIVFGVNVREEYKSIKKIKEEQYVKEIKSLRSNNPCKEENCEKSDDLTLEEEEQVWEWWAGNSKDFESEESVQSFVTKLLDIDKKKYREKFGDMKFLPSPIYMFGFDYSLPLVPECRQIEYDSLRSKVREKKIVEEYKTPIQL